jgi:hypothetical protein
VDNDAWRGRLVLLGGRHDVDFPSALREILGQPTPSQAADCPVRWKMIGEYEESLGSHRPLSNLSARFGLGLTPREIRKS